MIEILPLKTVKRIMKEQWDGEISHDACVYVRDYVYDVICIIVVEGINKFEDVNYRRYQQGLPNLKRLDKSAFLNVNSLYSQQISNSGEIGRSNKELFCRKQEAVEVV